jgi:hypothetical protein
MGFGAFQLARQAHFLPEALFVNGGVEPRDSGGGERS